MARQIPLTVSDSSTPELIKRGAVPSPQAIATNTVQVSTDILKNQLAARLEDLNDIFSELPAKVGDFEPSEMSISFAVSANGEISLLSALKGGVGVTATFVLTLARHGQK
jgi:hypothetical protein